MGSEMCIRDRSRYVFNRGLRRLDAEFGPFHRRLFDDQYRLADALLDAGLLWPALEQTLKCSHLFNILDARGAISVTERVALIARIRKMACQVAQIYVDRLSPVAEVQPA